MKSHSMCTAAINSKVMARRSILFLVFAACAAAMALCALLPARSAAFAANSGMEGVGDSPAGTSNLTIGTSGLVTQGDGDQVEAKSGVIGNPEETGLHWSFIGNLLTIYRQPDGGNGYIGTGVMPDWNKASDTPWYSFRTEIAKVGIDPGVENIGKNAFNGCSNLKTLAIENESNLEAIDDTAFQHTQFETAPNECTVTTTSKYVYQYAKKNFTAVQLAPLPISPDGNFIYAYGKGGSDEWVMGLTEQGRNATSLTIPVRMNNGKAVIGIAEGAFASPDQLHPSNAMQSLTFETGSKVKTIEPNAFAYCVSLTGTVTFPSSVEEIGDSAFEVCRYLQGAEFALGEDAKLRTIGSKAFCGCSSIKSMNIPKSVKEIGQKAFDGKFYKENDNENNIWHDGVEAITFPEGCGFTTVANEMFFGCKNVAIGSGVTTIDSYGFSDSTYKGKLESVTLPATVTTIGDNAFDNCGELTAITIPEAVTTIGDYAFSKCTKLSTVTIPANVESLGNAAFNGCTSLETLTFAGNLKLITIGHKAFYQCTKLDSVSIPDSVKSMGTAAFYGCTSLKTVLFTDGSQFSTFESDKFDNISGKAFGGCKMLQGFRVPKDVSSLTVGTFEGCTALVSVEFAEGTLLSAIESNAFNGCSALPSITIPDTVTRIGDSAFYKCSSLSSITLPAAVSYIGAGAFQKCTNLVDAVLLRTDSYIPNANCFKEIANPSRIHVNSRSAFETLTSNEAYLDKNRTYVIIADGSMHELILDVDEAGNHVAEGNTHVVINSPVYDGENTQFTATVTYDDGTLQKELVEGDDYVLELKESAHVGSVDVYIRGKGDFVGFVRVKTTVNSKVVSIPVAVENLVYNGANQTGVLGVGTIAESVDVVSGSDSGKDAGQHSIKLGLKDKAGSTWSDGTTTDKTINWSIAKKPATVSPKNAIKTYGESNPAFEVVVEGALDTESIEYNQPTCSAGVSSKVGSYPITVTGPSTGVNKNYQITFGKATLTVQAKDMSSAIVAFPDGKTSYGRTGKEIKPSITVSLNGATLTKGTDYEVAYSNNVDEGTATVMATGIGNYTGAVSQQFTITNEVVPIPVAVENLVYNGANQTGVPNVDLSNASAYIKVSGSDSGKDAGQYTITLRLREKAGFTWNDGTTADKTINWSIAKKPVTVTPQNAAKIYGENNPNFEVTVEGGLPSEQITYNKPTCSASAKSKVGSYPITVTGPTTGVNKNYQITFGKATLTVQAKDISSATVALSGGKVSYEYTGKEIKPAITVKLGGTTLSNGRDYKVTYSNNVNAGTATIVATGIGNYAGAASQQFTITSKGTSSSSSANTNTSTNTKTSTNSTSVSTAKAKTKVFAVGKTAVVKGATYLGLTKKTVMYKRAPARSKNVTIPATVKIQGKKYKVVGISANAFKSTKAKTVTIKTKLLKKAKVKNCFKSSKVKTVKVLKAKKKAYSKFFTKKICGRKVTVK